MTPEPPITDPKVDELTAKVNSLLDELAKEKVNSARIAKVAKINSKWTDFKASEDMNSSDFYDGVMYAVEHYKPAEIKQPKSNADPAPTGGSTKIRTPKGVLNSADVDPSMLAIIKPTESKEDDV
jgi:hypothetical protein